MLILSASADDWEGMRHARLRGDAAPDSIAAQETIAHAIRHGECLIENAASEAA